MTDADRIRAMREEGKIDDAQARRLLAAIEAIEEAEREAPTQDTQQAPTDGAGHAGPDASSVAEDEGAPAGGARTVVAGSSGVKDAADAISTAVTSAVEAATSALRTPAPPTPPAPPEMPTMARSTPAEAEDATALADTSSEVDRWLTVQLFACAVDATVDPALDAPVAETKDGTVTVEKHGNDWRITQAGKAEGTWLERLVSGVNQSKMRVRVPPRTGVRLDAKAGDVDLHGIPVLTGQLMAGDLDADGLKAVDLSVKAGDVTLNLDPIPGRHAVRLSVGDLDVRLAEGADVRVEGSVSIGDARARAPFVAERRGMVAHDVSGVKGAGEATLQLVVGTGDLAVKGPRNGS